MSGEYVPALQPGELVAVPAHKGRGIIHAAEVVMLLPAKRDEPQPRVDTQALCGASTARMVIGGHRLHRDAGVADEVTCPGCDRHAAASGREVRQPAGGAL